ncbi:hypothetical protein HDU98_003206 [Podochytrium sp. JEL0797]|nr:hypothetical protein HDU98_003206 [Podochytrium sp. JEL0797]
MCESDPNNEASVFSPPPLPPIPYLPPEAWSHIHDVHCHVIETPSTLASLPTLQTSKLWLMGTKPSDWPLIEQCGSAVSMATRVVQAFGIHPWFAHQTIDSGESLAALRILLDRHPASFVGEIGLDGVATHPGTAMKYDMTQQLDSFRSQWALAAELKRPVSVHAVGCFGKLEEFFAECLRDVPKDVSRKQREKLKKAGLVVEEEDEHPSLAKWPPAIMLHSYSGSVESIRNISRYPTAVASRFYFSFSHFVNSRTPFERMREKIRAVPDDRILVESDLHNVERVDEAVALAVELVARAKGWSLEETAVRTGANAMRFLSRIGR